MRVVITQPIYQEAIATMRASGLEVHELGSARPLSAEELATACNGADGVVTQLTDTVDEVVFVQNPQLRVVSNVAVGYDNIDTEAARRHGTAVTNTPGVLTEATADLAMALLLAVARRIPESDSMVRAGEFLGWKLMQHPMGVDVSGATIGIVGLGRVGRAVARRAHHGFDMPVLYSGREVMPDVESSLGAHHVPFEHLLEQSDFVSLHAPLLPETRHMVDGAALGRMKSTAILINTARGPLIDEGALADALRDGVILGAGLDVFEQEPLVNPHLLARHERVVLAPHVGSATEATRRRMSSHAAANVIAILTGRGTATTVTPSGSGPADSFPLTDSSPA
jgi:lactate dehydrogenase-like 2-hydroxyacid dehydrogenase